MTPAKPILLASKLHRPALPANLVERKRLIQHLQEGLSAGRQVTLVSASAGYGKTTLVVEWLEQVKRPVAWLSLEEADDQPLRFFSYFSAALQQVKVPLNTELHSALASGQLPPPEVLLGALVNGLAEMKTACLCVLDDFQVIQEPFILNVLQALVAHQPPQLHLVLITREDPALPLARLRARNQLTEIRAADLRFASDEADHFLRQRMGLALTEQDLARLEARTEGWIAGLQLAALAMQSTSGGPGGEQLSAFVENLSGSHRFILGYLTEEVLKVQPPEEQDFLLQTSILAKLTGDLCDAVTGASGSAARLERLLAANLFLIPLDDEGGWYRYHHLFADLLQNQLHRTRPQQVADLHQRASRWFEAHNQPAEAIEHALSAGDHQRVADLLETHAWQLLIYGYVRQVEAWMQAMPAERQTYSPRANLGFAWMHLLRGNFEQVRPYLQQAESALPRLDPAAPATTDLQAECLALRSNLMQTQGDIAGSLEAARNALQMVSPTNLRVTGLASLGLGAAYRQSASFDQAAAALQEAVQASQGSGDAVTGMLAVAHLTLMSLQQGRLRFAAEVAAGSIEHLQSSGAALPPIVGAVHGALGLIYYEWNQVDKARQHLLRGIRLATFSGHNASLIYGKANLARLLQGEGDLDAAAQLVAEAAGLLAHGAPGWVRPDLINRQVAVLLGQRNPGAAEALLRQSGLAPGDAVNHQTDALHLAWLRLLVHQRHNQALELARRIRTSADAGQRHGTALQALILGALFQAADSKAAVSWLRQALALAEPEGYLRIFIDEGPPMAALLRLTPESDYAQSLLSRFPSLQEKPNPSHGEPLAEPLSERELEVLRLLAEGLKYAEIADQLVVSINTVRYHVKGIYGKLGVKKLAQALERARSLDLL